MPAEAVVEERSRRQSILQGNSTMEFRQEKLVHRRINSQSVVDRIVARLEFWFFTLSTSYFIRNVPFPHPRELHGNSGFDSRRRTVMGRPSRAGPTRHSLLDTNRGFYTNTFPDFTMIDVYKPNCFLRKFSPDGKRFIAFSHCQTNLEIYFYKGPAACAELLHGLTQQDSMNSRLHDMSSFHASFTKVRN